MRRVKKGQTSLEFMFLVGFMFVIFAIFFLVIQNRTIEVSAQKNYISLKEISSIVKNEARLAQVFDDGYYKSFFIPILVYGRPYHINMSEDGIELSLIITGAGYLDFFDNVTYGNISRGKNTICKKEGFVHVNNCSGTLHFIDN